MVSIQQILEKLSLESYIPRFLSEDICTLEELLNLNREQVACLMSKVELKKGEKAKLRSFLTKTKTQITKATKKGVLQQRSLRSKTPNKQVNSLNEIEKLFTVRDALNTLRGLDLDQCYEELGFFQELKKSFTTGK